MTRYCCLIFLFYCALFASAQKPLSSSRLMDRATTKAEFPGGRDMLFKFLQKNINYPQMERDNDIQGKVVLRLLVDETGEVGDIEILRHVSPGLDKEALRVVKALPKWKPATYNNKPVAVYYVLPVVFRLN